MAQSAVQEVTTWLASQWDPDLTVGEWWERLGTAGWSLPTLPAEWCGRGISGAESAQVSRAIREFGAMGPPGGLGLLLAAPTIATHGTDEQKRRYLPDIVCGRKGWCQLFSEPNAGSDLAGVQTRAVRDGDGWIVNGQKVWSSTAHTADLGMLVARTNADVPKHKGLTYFLLDMHQPGIEIRPLREITGRSFFNEVFLTDVRVRRRRHPRRARQRLGRHEHDARLRAQRRWSGGRISRGVVGRAGHHRRSPRTSGGRRRGAPPSP